MKRTITNPYWINNARTQLSVEFVYDDNTRVKAVISSSDTSNPDLAEVKSKYTEAQIEANTKKQIQIKNESEEQARVNALAIADKKKQEELFAVKLDLFDTAVIKASTNRALKSKIRKASTIAEAHAYAAALLLDEHNSSIAANTTSNT